MNLPPDDPHAEGASSAARSMPQKPDLESEDRISKVTDPSESDNEDRHKTEELKSSDCHSEVTEELRMYHPKNVVELELSRAHTPHTLHT